MRSLAMLAGVLVGRARRLGRLFRRLPWRPWSAWLRLRRSVVALLAAGGRAPGRAAGRDRAVVLHQRLDLPARVGRASLVRDGHTPYGADYSRHGSRTLLQPRRLRRRGRGVARGAAPLRVLPRRGADGRRVGRAAGAARRRTSGSSRWRRSRCCRLRCSSRGRGARSWRSACCWPRTRSSCARRGSARPTRRRCCCSCSRSRSCCAGARAGRGSRSARRS